MHANESMRDRERMVKRQPIYRWECAQDDVVWRGPATSANCWCCGQPGRQVCQIADMEWAEEDAA